MFLARRNTPRRHFQRISNADFHPDKARGEKREGTARTGATCEASRQPPSDARKANFLVAAHAALLCVVESHRQSIASSFFLSQRRQSGRHICRRVKITPTALPSISLRVSHFYGLVSWMRPIGGGRLRRKKKKKPQGPAERSCRSKKKQESDADSVRRARQEANLRPAIQEYRDEG